MSRAPAADVLTYTERWLMSELAQLSCDLANFTERSLVTPGESPTRDEEFKLGTRLAQLGTVMQARAMDR